MRPLAQFLVGIGPGDPVAFALAPVVLVVAALMACLVPARRATRVHPTVALKT